MKAIRKWLHGVKEDFTYRADREAEEYIKLFLAADEMMQHK